MSFHTRRLKRPRMSARMREMVQETMLTRKDLIFPVFVQEGLKTRVKVDSMSDIERLPLEDVGDEVWTITDLCIPTIMLFGIPEKKDDSGTAAFDYDGIIQKVAAQNRQSFGDKIVIVADVCLCQYTSIWHCLVVRKNRIGNDKSIDTLAKIAVSQAKAGVDTVSPPAIMDGGQVAAIRTVPNDGGFLQASIMSHSAKHSSPFYSPFRDAVECTPEFGDKKTYQVPLTNTREVESDINEDVDIVMIKLVFLYLDLIAEAKRRFNILVAAYSVLGECALAKGQQVIAGSTREAS